MKELEQNKKLKKYIFSGIKNVSKKMKCLRTLILKLFRITRRNTYDRPYIYIYIYSSRES